MPLPDASEVGPLDDEALRPIRSVIKIRALCLGVIFGALVVVAILAAPHLAAGLHLAHRVEATVTSVQTVAGQAETGTGTRRCAARRITYTWGDGQSGTAQLCQGVQGAGARVGSTATIWVLPGWDRVVAGSLTPGTVLLVIEVLGLGLTGWALLAYARQLRLLRALSRAPIAGPALPAQRDRTLLSTGRQSIVRFRFDGSTFRPRRIVLGTWTRLADASSGWQVAELHALRRTVRGRPAGPYVLYPDEARHPRPLIGVGRPLRRARGSRPERPAS